MLENALAELFEEQASESPPPIGASIPSAVSHGRTRLRWRRVGGIGTPILVAAAVVAVSVTPALSHRAPPASPAHHHRPGHSLPVAPSEFNPLVLYATFGWLPAGARQAATNESHTVEFLNAVGPRQASWQLAIFARGDCALTGSHLACRDLTTLQEPMATRSAPAVDGFAGYWDYPYVLIFEYAHGGWATLTLHGPNDQPDAPARAMALHIADGLRLGAPGRPTRFPAQLVGLPSGWGIRAALTSQSRFGPLEFQYQIAVGALVTAPWFDSTDIPDFGIAPASQSPSVCYVTPGQSQQLTVAGHQVTVTRVPAGNGEPAEQDLCAKNVDGLSVDIDTSGNHPPMDVTGLFAHLRMLGPDPARWTTRPIG
jgi:hypothetical protein